MDITPLHPLCLGLLALAPLGEVPSQPAKNTCPQRNLRGRLTVLYVLHEESFGLVQSRAMLQFNGERILCVENVDVTGFAHPGVALHGVTRQPSIRLEALSWV